MRIKLTDIPCFYINMDKDIERAQNTERLLKELGFKDITRVSAVLGDPGNDSIHAQGCAKSHLKAFQLAEDRLGPGVPFIIFEDDIDIKVFQDEIDIPDNTDVLYLGNAMVYADVQFAELGDMYSEVTNEKVRQTKQFPWIYRIKDVLTSHAILYITQRYIDLLKKHTMSGLNNPSRLVPIDVTMAKLQFDVNCYTTNEPIFWQNTQDRLINQVTTVFPMSEHENVRKHYPHNYEEVVTMAQFQVKAAIDFKKTHYPNLK